MPYEPPPHLAELTLSQIAEQVAQRKLPPVEGWAPQKLGDSRMRIAADGQWYHDGSPITRDAMMRAFSGLLIRDGDGQHFLISPFEKLSIEVEDAAFVATDVVRREGGLAFRLNTDEFIIAGPDHALRAAGDPETPAIYLYVRRGCEARLNRSTWQQLADIALEESEDMSVESAGKTFSLIPEAA
ncbi:DUF1285 domain-containing protein [Altererythrobacter lutimaris]|uniref:DUF1285 domain-containing protein n=1 Tax=Altererythrobacter lutimaris TaxID=2743979 RepID=A0A850H646_9SPHN|nr:DUF1285 domain-containing protein [Altererythrobacter lutimaris]NVE94617.1 DUF1285 domain-containing protein [Altererythrobacter lutimaris]